MPTTQDLSPSQQGLCWWFLVSLQAPALGGFKLLLPCLKGTLQFRAAFTPAAHNLLLACSWGLNLTEQCCAKSAEVRIYTKAASFQQVVLLAQNIYQEFTLR